MKRIASGFLAVAGLLLWFFAPFFGDENCFEIVSTTRKVNNVLNIGMSASFLMWCVLLPGICLALSLLGVMIGSYKLARIPALIGWISLTLLGLVCLLGANFRFEILQLFQYGYWLLGTASLFLFFTSNEDYMYDF